jgi:hypothetical protein
MGRADDYLLDKKLETIAKVIPLVCKLMHEYEPKKSSRLPLGCERKDPRVTYLSHRAHSLAGVHGDLRAAQMPERG